MTDFPAVFEFLQVLNSSHSVFTVYLKPMYELAKQAWISSWIHTT